MTAEEKRYLKIINELVKLVAYSIDVTSNAEMQENAKEMADMIKKLNQHLDGHLDEIMKELNNGV